MIHRSLSVMTLVLCLGLSLSCTRKTESSKDTLIVALSASPANLDPRFATDAGGHRLAALLFSSLVRTGPDLEIVGEAASSWSYGQQVYRFELRPNLSFSNGRPLTRDDIEFSFREFMSEKSPFASAFKPIQSIEARYDEKERYVKIQLRQFSASFLSDLGSLKLLPKPEVEAAGLDFGKRLIGSGPFAFVSADANEIRFKAREAHAYAAPRIGNVVFKIIRDDNTRYLKMLKGEIDLAQQELPPNKIKELEKSSDLQVVKYPGLGMTYLLVNLEDPVLKSLNVRKAISAAINREEIIRYKLDGLAAPATSILTPINPFFNRDLAPLVFNLDEAKKQIAAAGALGKEIVLIARCINS